MTHILRVRRTDRPKEHLLVNVTQTGSRALDLKLVATDQEHLFHQTIKDARVDSLQAPQAEDDLQAWKSMLSYVLLQKRPDGPLPNLLRGIEAIASISKQTVSLRIQKNIDGITQRLGVITLDQDDEREEVSAFDWVDTAVASSDGLREELETLQSSLVSQQDQIAKLTAQLDELVKAKREHEEELLSKFAVLLNSKKQKIRDQQRLLSGAKVDSSTAEAVHQARLGESYQSRKPQTSRIRKRRAEPHHEGDDPEQNGEGMDGIVTGEETDTDADQTDEDAGRRETPVDSDGDAEDEHASAVKRMEIDDIEVPPPRRELPFTRKPQAKGVSPPSSQILTVEKNEQGDEDDEETDDEL